MTYEDVEHLCAVWEVSDGEVYVWPIFVEVQSIFFSRCCGWVEIGLKLYKADLMSWSFNICRSGCLFYRVFSRPHHHIQGQLFFEITLWYFNLLEIHCNEFKPFPCLLWHELDCGVLDRRCHRSSTSASDFDLKAVWLIVLLHISRKNGQRNWSTKA